ncbi:MAG TPA: DUF6569 family protein [Methanomicrobiales archaeon]|nr:DUF6569 family protein [Methanomicrobiales archaeon]
MDNCLPHKVTVEFGDPQYYGTMGVVPLIVDGPPGPAYITLNEAIRKSLLTVSEVSEGGSVPQLKLVSTADVPILLLDGEELMGAKQNRVLNTTILVPPRAAMAIPVTCTEHGRWSYTSRTFADSDVLMASQIRRKKAQAVSDSLRNQRSYASDQAQVWNEIHMMSAKMKVASPTGAMKDAFEVQKPRIEEYLSAFPVVPHQRGLMVSIGGKIVGLELLSQEDAYASLHGKLVKSYAMEAIAEDGKTGEPITPEKAMAFLKEADTCTEERFQSVGMGWDCRFRGPSMVGSALLVDEAPIHMAFFRQEDGPRHIDDPGPMAGFRSRRSHYSH